MRPTRTTGQPIEGRMPHQQGSYLSPLFRVVEAPLVGPRRVRPGPEFTDNFAIIAADGDEAPTTQDYFDSRARDPSRPLDDALPADRDGMVTGLLVGCGGCDEYTRRIGRTIRAQTEAAPDNERSTSCCWTKDSDRLRRSRGDRLRSRAPTRGRAPACTSPAAPREPLSRWPSASGPTAGGTRHVPRRPRPGGDPAARRSHVARTITATEINFTGGAVVD